jgi:acetyltransferase-like isoleucine patch superfamily enzyme
LGGAQQFEIGRGAVIGPRVRLDPAGGGHVVLGEKVWFAADTEIETGTMVRIGGGTTVQRRCSINGSTRIGRGCILAPNVFISSGTHPFRAYPHLPIREQEKRLAADPLRAAGLDKPVWIQDDCWLGVNSVICPGVTIGKGSVVGANAVVTRDVPPYSIVAGAPARPIGCRLDWRPPSRIYMDKEEDLVYVLSGVPVYEGNKQKAVGAAINEPLSAVIEISAENVRVHYRASATMTLQIGGKHLVLDAGEGVMELTNKEMTHQPYGYLLQIIVPSTPTVGELQIFWIESD